MAVYFAVVYSVAMASNAVSSNWVSAVLGFLLAKGYFNPSSPNLPQSIVVLGEANHANQSGLSTDLEEVTSAKEIADLYGHGSPMDSMGRILFPPTGVGVTVPVYTLAQAAASGAVAKVITITPTGTATAPGTIYLKINGRKTLDGGVYSVGIEVGDDEEAVCDKIRASIAAVLGCPALGTGTTTAILTAKWKGLTSNEMNVAMDLNGTDTGVSFAIATTTAGSGTPAVTTSLAKLGNGWYTCIVNGYGLVDAVMDELETYNGVPDPVSPTGQYGGIVWRPMWAFSGTVADDPTSITDAGERPTNVTIVPCPAPMSLGMSYEAAANYVRAIIGTMQNSPEADPAMKRILPDMPSAPAGSNPQMNNPTFRQYCVTHGCSTAEFINGATGNGQYRIWDLVTTYNEEGEFPPFYRWVRDLNIYFNYKFGYRLLEEQKLHGKTLVTDGSTASTDTVVRPSGWKAEVAAYNLSCERRALIVNAAANNKKIQVDINDENPNRLDTIQDIQISGVVRVGATTIKGGFNFSN